MQGKWGKRWILGLVGVLIVLVLVGFTKSDTFFVGRNGGTQVEWPALWGAPDNQYKCEKNEQVRFSSLPVAFEDILFVQPIGELREGHIIPGDHAGIDYQTSPSSTPVKVYAPADGYVVGIEKHPYTPPAGYPRDLHHYHVYVEHSCTLFSGFVHVTEFSNELVKISPELKTLSQDTSNTWKNVALRVPLKAGQEIGTAWSFGLLGWVTVDLNHTNTGYLNPESYAGENWRMHSVSFYDYLTDALKAQVRAKTPRTTEPVGGKIDFDREGKLVGNWFAIGSGGLAGGSKSQQKQCGNFPCPYWDGHLALVYDYVDPKQLRVSVGHDWRLADKTPFGVKGNGPDFAKIGATDGVTKYELVGLRNLTRERGYDSETALITESDDTRVLGTLLVQVVDTNTVRVEIFAGKTKDQAAGFTAKAILYER